ncbi:MAG: N-acetylneuraminate synthase [Spirochaetae bacterium HGW-Spirochaetae-5]|jgi:N-acetylneuraminate synthase|nr:MAG: N-acetylneuraminate synthase [Spirochaetae bacterium HGW-Spirochaetae-5]
MSFLYDPILNADSKVKVIAEIGCNHRGDISTAKEMIKIAKIFCGVNYVKFQKRNNKELLTAEEYSAPHPNPYHSYGATYGEHREYLEFSLEQHLNLKTYCDEIGIGYSTSVWDLTSAKEIASLNPDFIKIPSACNLNWPMLSELRDNYNGDIHISMGMTTKKEEENIIYFFTKKGAGKRVIIYACTSGYPVPYEELALLEIKRLRETFGNDIKDIGFSGHHNGIAADIAGLTLGANWFERHYTLDRTWKGTDHAASLEPDGLRKLVRDLHNVEKALKYKEQDLLEIEKVQRNKLKRIEGKHF